MRIALTILFYSLCQNIFATNYYVANVGNDANSGDIGNPFATIAKANEVAVSGDIVYLNRGDSWHEKVYPVSGVTYDAYGSGIKPLITGFVSVTGFTNVGNIWTASVDAPFDLNTVLFNGSLAAKARYPNSGYLTFTSFSGDSAITGTLTGTPDYTGAELVVRSARWLLNKAPITSQSSGTLYHTSLRFTIHGGVNGYFIQNASYLIDSLGEWYYDTTAKTLSIYSLTEPTVSVGVIDTLFYLNNKSNVSINNITFTGSNFGAIINDTCDHITINNCTFNDNGFNAIYGRKSVKVSITNDSIISSLNGAIMLTNDEFLNLGVDQCDSAIITNNYIKHISFLPGMGGHGEGRYIGVWVTGNAFNISNNVIDSIGYIGVYFNGVNGLIKNNVISNYCFTKDDGGGIYTIISYLPVTTAGTRIVSNIIMDGRTAPGGALGTVSTHGIYMDTYATGVIVDSNTVFNGGSSGLLFHAARSITVRNNTFYNGGNYNFYLDGLENVTGRQHHITHNIFYKDNNNLPSQWSWLTSGKTNFGLMDSNYYSNSVDQNKIVTYMSVNYSLPEWVTYSGEDSNSVSVPAAAISDTAIFKYNSADSNVTYPLNGLFVDFMNNRYYNQITLAPFTSAVLFKTGITGLLQTRFKKVTHK